MKAIQVGQTFPNVNVISFLSDIYILDYDLIIIDLTVLMKEFSDYIVSNRINFEKHQQFINILDNKRVSIQEFYKHGGNVIVIANKYPEFQYSYVKPQSGETKFNVPTLNLFAAEKITTTSQKGSIVEISLIIEPLIETCNFNYHVLFSDVNQGKPLFWTKKIKETVGFYSVIDKGIFVCLPSFSYKNVATNTLDATKKVVLEKLIEIVSKIRQSSTKEDLDEPDWVINFHIGKESTERQNLNKLSTQLQELQKSIDTTEVTLKHYTNIKSLLYLDGTPLELTICDYLEKLGFTIEKPSGYDVDLIINHDEFTGVLEVKGVKGSAAKSHVRQLENWVNNYSITNNQDAKGILIINTYKHLSVNERVEISFPPDMVAFSIQRDHCLLLTIDLVNIYIDFEENLIDINEITLLLKGCVGVLKYSPRYVSK